MSNAETAVGKVLLIGVTGGTGSNAVKGLLEQNVIDLRAITRKIDLERPSLSKLHNVELVEADLDDEASLQAAFADVSGVYCHATAPDSAKPDPQEIARSQRVAQAAQQANVSHFVYNSAGGVDRNFGIPHIEQKHQVEQILKIHFIHERGTGENPLQIVLTHGFPDSFFRFYKIIPLLTDPENYGGDQSDAFDVIVPSLPGCGFSERPTKPGITARVADLWHKLMTEKLGY